jgi:hypothetical protein
VGLRSCTRAVQNYLRTLTSTARITAIYTVGGGNTVLFGIDTVRKMNNSELLKYVNPLNPDHVFNNLRTIPRSNFLLYEVQFDTSLFNGYVRFKSDKHGMPDLTTLRLALDETVRLMY